jgi:hypothetical protein
VAVVVVGWLVEFISVQVGQILIALLGIGAVE